MRILHVPEQAAGGSAVRAIGTRLFATEVLAGLGKIDLPTIDFASAKRLARQALVAVGEGRLGYTVVCGTKE